MPDWGLGIGHLLVIEAWSLVLGEFRMATFVYTARDDAGAPCSGTLAADTVQEVTQILRRDGKYPTSVRPADDDDAGGGYASSSGGGYAAHEDVKISRTEVIQLSTQLAIMLETGVTLIEALDCIAAQQTRPNVKALVEDLSTQVQGGGEFSRALSRHPRSFPRLYVAMIRASEKSGMMSKMMNRAVAYLRDEQDIVRKVKGALTYPAIMFAFALTTTIFLLAFVLPKFTAIYANKGAALPVPTRVLMAASHFVVHHYPVLILGTLFAAAGAYFYVGTPGGARAWHGVQLRIPLVGPMLRKLHLARGMRMIGTMAGAGVTLVDCVTTAHDLCGNLHFRDLWDEVSRKIQTGKQLSDPLFASPLVPRSVAQMIHSGEKSGKLAAVMEQVSTFAEQELKDKITELTRYIEPAMIIFMGLLIGGVALALMLPIFTISRVVAH
jgi:type IV pilus assembly protein PilC